MVDYLSELSKRKARFNEYSFGIVKSRFNLDLTDTLHVDVKYVLKKNEVKYSSFEVPGSMEIPLASQWVFEYKRVDAIIALGVIIRGETSHYDSVCRILEKGCLDVQLKYGKPIISGILTVENKAQAIERISGEKGNRGKEIAKAAIRMRYLYSKVSSIDIKNLNT